MTNPRDSPEERVNKTVGRVSDTYEAIADHFSETRHHPWPDVAGFIEEQAGENAVDIGTGNGRHAELLAERADRVVGVDVSPTLLARAAARLRDRAQPFYTVRASATHLPIRGSTIDIALYIATIHHLPTRASRRQSLNELARVLTPGGQALVSAWSTRHEQFSHETTGFDTHVDWTRPDGTTVPRYYHIYDPDEFDRDLHDSHLTPTRIFVSRGNCYAVVTA